MQIFFDSFLPEFMILFFRKGAYKMKRWISDFLICIFAGILLPALLLSAFFAFINHRETVSVMTKAEEEIIPITVRTENGMITMDIEDYVFRVILAEIPSDFELEAIKAQAIASRTYAQRALYTGGKHGDGSVCDNSSCCQAYLAGEADSDNTKFHHAINETRGMILTYAGEPIEATYFSCSGGATEDAREVWGHDYPYLRSQPSPENNADKFHEEKAYSKAELEQTLKITLPDSSAAWFTDWTYTEGGGVASVTVGSRLFRGTQIRKLLNLRSTLFTAIPDGKRIRIQTSGYGHRVGMSQYGADTLAVQGESCFDILEYYYPGTEIHKLSAF